MKSPLDLAPCALLGRKSLSLVVSQSHLWGGRHSKYKLFRPLQRCGHDGVQALCASTSQDCLTISKQCYSGMRKTMVQRTVKQEAHSIAIKGLLSWTRCWEEQAVCVFALCRRAAATEDNNNNTPRIHEARKESTNGLIGSAVASKRALSVNRPHGLQAGAFCLLQRLPLPYHLDNNWHILKITSDLLHLLADTRIARRFSCLSSLFSLRVRTC